MDSINKPTRIPLQPDAFPRRVTLELTNRCNLRCTFCPRPYMEPARGDMDRALAGRIIDELAEHAPVQVAPFFRGETLLHPQWREILGDLKQRAGGPIQMTTNATRLDESATAAILDLEVDFISFSLLKAESSKFRVQSSEVKGESSKIKVKG